MNKRIAFIICGIVFSLLASAQASGGQIRRNTPKPKTEVRKTSKSRHTKVQTEQNAPTYTPPATPEVQLTPLSSLPTYNLVIGSFSIGANAQYLSQSMKDRGYSTKIYFEPTTSPPMYRVIAASAYTESDIMYWANKLKSDYPGSWILCVENGQTRRIRID
jgi:hypothetical protein